MFRALLEAHRRHADLAWFWIALPFAVLAAVLGIGAMMIGGDPQ